mmetsp:Transcript_435/g.1135  ORF Transcript_435/g.1135 Transcript_435/m.1135 type:complete len:328 (-) Transcript_435:561-1544(-)
MQPRRAAGDGEPEAHQGDRARHGSAPADRELRGALALRAPASALRANVLEGLHGLGCRHPRCCRVPQRARRGRGGGRHAGGGQRRGAGGPFPQGIGVGAGPHPGHRNGGRGAGRGGRGGERQEAARAGGGAAASAAPHDPGGKVQVPGAGGGAHPGVHGAIHWAVPAGGAAARGQRAAADGAGVTRGGRDGVGAQLAGGGVRVHARPPAPGQPAPGGAAAGGGGARGAAGGAAACALGAAGGGAAARGGGAAAAALAGRHANGDPGQHTRPANRAVLVGGGGGAARAGARPRGRLFVGPLRLAHPAQPGGHARGQPAAHLGDGGPHH